VRLFDQIIFYYAVIITLGMFFLGYLLYRVYRNQNKLQKQILLLQKIMDTVSFGIHFIDKEGKTRLINPTAEIFFQLSKEQILGKFDWDLCYGGEKFDGEGNYNSLITETLETGKTHKNIEKIFVNEYGNEVTFLVDTYRLYDPDQQILGALGIYRNITQQKEIERQLLDAHYEMANIAVTDELTGLYNFRYFRQRLNEEVAKAFNSKLSLLIIDADYFKAYNDLYGHPAGDQVLKQLAQIIKQNIRETDLVARYGGEEFTVILPGMGKENAKEVAERIRIAVRNFEFSGEKQLPSGILTVTIGVATIPDDAKNSDELILLADQALYKGKYGNRDKVVSF